MCLDLMTSDLIMGDKNALSMILTHCKKQLEHLFLGMFSQLSVFDFNLLANSSKTHQEN